MTDKIVANFNCAECGPTELKFDEKLGDGAPVFCAKCGADFKMTYGAIKDEFFSRTEKIVDNLINDAFKGTGWKSG